MHDWSTHFYRDVYSYFCLQFLPPLVPPNVVMVTNVMGRSFSLRGRSELTANVIQSDPLVSPAGSPALTSSRSHAITVAAQPAPYLGDVSCHLYPGETVTFDALSNCIITYRPQVDQIRVFWNQSPVARLALRDALDLDRAMQLGVSAAEQITSAVTPLVSAATPLPVTSSAAASSSSARVRLSDQLLYALHLFATPRLHTGPERSVRPGYVWCWLYLLCSRDDPDLISLVPAAAL